MAIFDNELVANTIGNTDLESPAPALGSPSLSQLNPNTISPVLGVGSSLKRGLSLKELADSAKSAKSTGFGISPSSIPQKELIENQRYTTYQRGVDLENIKALQQPWYNRLANGTIKMGATAVGTFAQGFATIPNTISAIKNGEISKLSGEPDGYEASIDNWLKNIEDVLPNYYSRYEKEHPFTSIIPGFTGSANFWGDKIIKNLGFTAGAIGSAIAQDAIVGAATEGLGEIPLVANQIGKASLYLNKIFSGTNRLEETLTLAKSLGKSEKSLLNIEKLAQLSAATNISDGFRWATSIYGSARTEAAIEARDGYRQVKDTLVKQYQLEHGGDSPTGEDQKQIDNYAEDAMNTRFGINMALLTVSNAVQFGSLFKSFTSSEKAIQGILTREIEDAGKIGLQKGSLDVFERKAPINIADRIWSSVRPSVPNILSEGIYEEGGQYATEKGVYDYYTRKYKTPATWNSLNETIDSTVKGLKDQFGTTEGVENMIVGAISALISGGVMGKIDNIRGQGKDARLQSSINILNNHALTSTLEKQYTDTLNSVGIANDMKEAVAKNDVFRYKNLKDDMFFDFVMSRIPSGMHDVTLEQLNMLKGLSKEDFEKTFGMDFNSSNKSTVASYVDSLIDQSNKIKKSYESIDGTFRNPFNFIINPETEDQSKESQNYKTFNNYKVELTYLASKSPIINDRLESIQQSVFKLNPSVTLGVLEEVSSKEGLKRLSESYEERAKQINESIVESTPSKDRRILKNQVKSLRTLSERINLSLNSGQYDSKLFDKLLNFELNGQDDSRDRITSPEQAIDLLKLGHDADRLSHLKEKTRSLFDALSSKEGFVKYFDQQEKVKETPVITSVQEVKENKDISNEFENKSGEKEKIEVGREYQIPSLKKAKYRKVAEDRWKVIDGAGNFTFRPTKEEAIQATKDLNSDFTDLTSVKVLAINPDGTVKVEDLSENIQNIPLSQLKGYEKVLTDQERLLKHKEELAKQQEELQKKSGTTPTPGEFKDVETEDKKKSSDILFISTSSESQEKEVIKPQTIRQNTLLNNIKNFPNKEKIRVILITPNQEQSIGVEGLTALSFENSGVNPSEYTNVDNGLVAAIYVEQDGKNLHFIDENGKRTGKIGDKIDLNKVVFSTMPTTSLTWSNGKERYRSDEKEEAIEQSKRWKAKREQLFSLPANKYETYKFSISRGIPIIADNNSRFPIGNNLIPEDKIATQKGLIITATTDTITHQGQNLKFPKGVAVLQYDDTLQFINNNKFNKQQAVSIFGVMKSLSEYVKKQANKGEPIKLDKLGAKFLQNVLYWRKSKDTSGNQIFIDTDTMEFFFSGKKYDLTNLAAHEEEIVNQLQEVYHQINDKTLKNEFDEPFLEPYSTDKGFSSRTWKNYQSYLLSTKYPDGSNRNINDVPLSTAVSKPTEAIPYNFKQKYATLQGIDLPIVEVKQQPAKIEVKEEEKTPKLGDYVIDNKTQNTFIAKAGPVIFTAKKGDKDQIYVTVYPNETTAKVAENEELVNGTIIPILRQTEIFDENAEKEKLVTQFFATRISFDLQKQLENKPQAPAKIETKPGITGKKFTPTNSPEKSEYRRIGENTPKITEEELQLFKEWHKENVPNIPYEILENILVTHDNERAWGTFENGIAKFYKGAIKGTEYHEVFEGVWKAFLREDEKQAILDEFKAKKGQFTDRASGKKINYDEATDLQAKERIADDFSDYRVGKISAKSIGEKIRQFFKNIIEFFKQFINKPSKKQELFKAIDTGKFKEYVVPERAKNEFSEYRKIGDLSEQQTNDFVQDITARAFQIIFKDNISLFSPEKVTADDIFGQIKDMYTEEGKLNPSETDKLNDVEFEGLVKRTKDFLRTFKIEFDEDNILTINDEDKENRSYAPEPFSTNWKKSSPYPVKLLLGTLTEAVAQNQEGASNIELPELKQSSVFGYKLLNFSRAFATVLDKLANTNKVSEMTDKLLNLAKYDANYVRLFTRLKGNRNIMEIDFSKFEPQDWRLFINFYQTFTKQKPDAYIQYVKDGEVYTASANLFTNIKSVKDGWIANIRQLAKTPEGIVKYNKSTKTFQVEDLKDIRIKTPKQQIEFLSKIGVEFPMEVYLRLKTEEVKSFGNAVSSIYTYINSNKDVMSVTGKTLQINTPLNTLAELLVKVTNPNQDPSFIGIDGKRMQSFADNNAASVFENTFNSSDTLDDLLKDRPELQDVFSQNSQVLKKGGLFFNEEGRRIKKIKVGYVQGTINLDNNKETPTNKMSLGDRLVQEINQNLNGRYYILVPADSSTEWMMDIGNNIPFDDGSNFSRIYDIFKGYLKDDVTLAKENREYLKNVGNKGKELRIFKDILSPSALKKINTLLKEDATDEEIFTIIDENIAEINSSIKEWIDSTVEETKQLLLKDNEIIQLGEEEYSFPSLDDNFAKDSKINKYSLSTSQLYNVLKFANSNYIINNIEFHKILFGDPYQFKIKNNQLDETKRIKSFLSPRRTTFDTDELNTHLNQNFNEGIDEKEIGYHNFKSYTNSVTISDVEIDGPLMGKTNEADAASWMMDSTYREVKIKNGQWSEEAEKWHQWQLAYTRLNIPNYIYQTKGLKEKDEKLVATPEPNYTIEVLKPIVSGSIQNNNKIEIVLHKFSQMPVYYKAVQGTNLEKLYIKMWREKVGYVITESGEKVGTQSLHKLYNEDGSFNTEPFNNTKQIPWNIYGIQVENSYDGPKEQTRGSQLTKLSSLDMFDRGVAISETAKKEYERNRDILNRMHKNAYNNLLEELGIEDLDGLFKLVDKTAVSQTLKRELLKREMSENAKDVLELDEKGEFRIPFEASTHYVQIRDTLFSMVDKAIISPKMNGGSHVQVPVTLWESINSNKSTTSPKLKFYEDEEGKRYCEVLLPAWFKDKLSKGKFKTDEQILNYLNNSKEGQSILTGVGFRIPTQSSSSIEVFRVKGFLPSFMGRTVVVPSEITTKAGSDFDIDKLNMYLKSVYIDEKGNIKLVKLQGNEEETKEFYGKLFDRKLEGKKLTKSNLLEALQILSEGLEDPKNLVEKYSDILNSIVESTDDIYEAQEELIQKIEELGDESIQSGFRDKFIKDMYKRSLENEYYDSLEKLITLPENFKRLTSPVDDAGLKKIAESLDTLRKEDESSIKNRILNRNYMTSLRNAFLTGKKWVGIAAVNITGQSLTQKADVFIDSDKFLLLSETEQKFLGDGSVALPHNTNEEGNISISGVKTADGKEYISDRLSGYATSFVDVAKDPYILKIIKSDLAIGTFMFLERIGVGKNTAYFMNQPIIIEYLNYLDSIGSKNLYNPKNIKTIKSNFVANEKDIQEAQIDVQNLKDNISQYYEKGKFQRSVDNAAQHKILDEFLKYAKMAEYSFKLTQASNYDTTAFRSTNSLYRKQARTTLAREKNIFSSVDKLLDNSFIGEQSFLLAFSSEALGEILKLDKYDFRQYINQVLKPYAEKEFFSDDKYNTVGNKAIASFLDYIIQTKSELNQEIKDLLVETSKSVAAKLAEAKKNHPEIAILKDLQQTSSGRIEGATSVKLRVNLKEAYDENLYTDMMRELRDTSSTNPLYKDLVKLAILQGTYQSAISIKNIIPVEDYSEIIAPIIEKVIVDPELNGFLNGAFQRNNWKDKDIFTTVTPKFFDSSKQNKDDEATPAYIDQFGNNIYQYFSPAFPNISPLNIKSRDRRILILGEKYNFLDVQNDYLLVPRVVVDKKTGERVNMIGGKTVTNADFARRKAKGDLSLKDVFGYQKVKNLDGTPLTIYGKDGNKQYVYKMINLWGDGQYASEYYSTPRPSVLNNGTVKIGNEIPDSDIITYFSPKTENLSMKKDIENDKLLLSEPMNYKMPKSENIIGSDTTTFDLIREGKRTSTTRGYWYNTVKGGIKINDFIGKIVTFKSPKNETVDVLIKRVHKISKEDRENPDFLNQWENSEKWTKEHLLRETKIGEYQVQFELLNKDDSESSNSDEPKCS